MHTKGTRLVAVCAGMVMIAAGAANAASSSYIDTVRADLAEFEQGRFTPPAENEWLGQTEHGSDGTGSLAEFDAFVKKKFRGTYILFARLPSWKKNEIWQKYVETGDLGGIRSNIYAARRSGSKRPAPSSSLSNLPLDF